MKYLFTFLILFAAIAISAQRQFSVVCNQNENKLEVVISGTEQPHQRVIKDKFPNQRAAESYITDNASTIECGSVPDANLPPPTTAGRNTKSPEQPTTNTGGQNSTTQVTEVRVGGRTYNRHFSIKGGIGTMFGMDELYPGNIESFTQTLGYNIGAELYFGKKLMGGVGIYYTSLYGSFEEVLLDVDIDDQSLYGALKGPMIEVFMRVPTRVGKESWFLYDFGVGVYFDSKTTVDESLSDLLVPLINDQFYDVRFGLGVDYKRLILMLNLGFVAGISEDIDKGSFFHLGLTVGYAF